MNYGIIDNPWAEGGGGGGGGSDINVVNNLTTNSATDALSASMGMELKSLIDTHSSKIAKSASEGTTTAQLGHVIVDGTTIKIDANGVISSAATVSIADDLTTDDATKVLSAKQGVALKGLIDTHASKVASTTELGHVKVDGDSIQIDSTTGVISVNLDFEGNLRKEEIVEEGLTGVNAQITFTPQIVATPFVEFVYVNTIKINPLRYTRVDNTDGSTTITLLDELKATDLINITLLSGLANGDEGEPLIKESFRFDNLVTTSQQGITIPFSPVEVTETFIDFVYVNTTKLEESEYSIVQTNANPLEYDLILDPTVEIDENIMVNLVLVDGKGFGGGGSGSNVEVVDNLTTQDTTKALSANQGYVLDTKITEHSELIASDTVLGHVKVDKNTIKIDNDGVISVDLDIQGNLRKEEIVVENLTVGANSIVITPQLVNEKFVDLVYYNTTKVNPNQYTLADNGDGTFTLTLDDVEFEATDLINVTLIAGLADGTDGEPLKKESFRIENFVTAPQQGATIPFQPTQVKDTFIDLVYVNTTKLEESEYQIVKTSDSPLSYNLVLNNTVEVDEDTMVNIVLIDGLGIGGSGGGSSVDLYHTVDQTDDKAVTPKAVYDYIESLSGDLAKYEFEIKPLTQGQVEFDMPTIYDPTKHIDFLFFNTLKLSADQYRIQEKVAGDATQGYKLVLANPAPDYTQAVYNLVLVSGRALGGQGGGEGTVTSVQGILPVNGDVTLPLATDTIVGLTQLTNVVDINETNKPVTSEAVITYIESLESDLTKQAFNLIPTAVGQTEIDMPAIYDPNEHIDIIFSNSIKLLEDRYSIVEKLNGDPTQGYKLVLVDPVVDPSSTLYNLLLISGRAIGGASGGTGTVVSVNGYGADLNGNVELPTATTTIEGLTTLTNVVDINDNTKAVTSEAIVSYIEDLEGTLTKTPFELSLNTGSTTEIDMPTDYDPTKHIEFLFFNGIKLPESTYSITGDATQGYKIVLDYPPSDPTTALYNLTLVSGFGVGGNGGGSNVNVINNLTSNSATDALSANQGRVLDGKITTVNTRVDDLQTEIDNINTLELSSVVENNETKAVNGKAVIDYVDSKNGFYYGSTPPTDTNLFWIRTP